MKKLVIVMLLSLFALSSQAQEPQPTCKLDERKIIDILADYDIEHQSAISAGMYWGLTDTRGKKIYVDSTPDLGIRRLTVLHELLHVCYSWKAVDTHAGEGEAMVAQQAREMYVKLYGGDQ